MSKFFYAILLTLALATAVAAQTRRGTTAAGQRPSTNAQGRPATQPTPAAAAPKTTGAQQQASATTPVATNASAGDCGCEPGPLPEVLATVNGIKITQADISPETQQQIQQLRQQVIETRKSELDLQINNILLEAEAKKRGVTTKKLYEDEVLAKTVEPTQADAQAFFNQNKAQIEQQAGGPVDFTQVKDQVVGYLRSQRQDEREKSFAQSLRAGGAVKVLVQEPTPPSTPADRARVFATVNGKNITSGDIEDTLLPLVAQVRDQLYLLRKNDVDLRVNDILLSQEAQKRGVTARALIESEVASKVPVITEAQAQEFYDKNKERINGDFPTTKYQIIQYLQQQEQQRLEGAFAERLRNAATVQTFITPPAPVAYKIATDDQPEKGNPNASVTVVEFTDYQCPSCAAAQPALERLMTEYGDRVRFVIRDFPLQQHADAEKAAEAAEAAREQGKYWDFTAILFHNQSALQPDKLKGYAQVLGLDRAKFDAALDSGKFAEKIQRDQIDGQKVGVNSTPSFFVNGVRIREVTYDGLKAAIDSALKSPAKP
jgi:protein-disulfide isomerase